MSLNKIDKKDYKIYGPFKVWTIENFPFIEEDFDAITNYQLYCKIVEHMRKLQENQNILQNANNELIESFNNLVQYVDDYFNNLDVQEEINNKLDEMAENGTLEEIITAYINLKSLLVYDNVSDMKQATNLVAGSYARTLGYHTLNDGGESLYKVREIINTDVVDEGGLISLADENLVAELINTEIIKPEQFGAKGDNTTNDNTSINNCINYAYTHKSSVKFTNNKTYIVNTISLPTPINVDFNNAVLKSSGDDAENSVLIIGDANDTFETKTLYVDKFNISNINVNCDNTNRPYGVEIHVRRNRFNRIYVSKATNKGIYVGDNDGVWIDSIFVSGNNTDTLCGVEIDADDTILGNVEVAYCKHGIIVSGPYHDIIINAIHSWCDIDESSCIKFSGNSYYADIKSIVMDSVKYAIDISSVSGYGKMHVGTITVFPSVNFASTWRVVNVNTALGTMGIVIDNIYGLSDTDTTNRFTNFRGTLLTGLNYNQKPTMTLLFDEQNASCNMEQQNGFWYQTNNATITGTGDNDVWLGRIGAESLRWIYTPILCLILNSSYIPIGIGLMTFNETRRAKIRCDFSLVNGTTYRFRIMTPLPSGYAYSE